MSLSEGAASSAPNYTYPWTPTDPFPWNPGWQPGIYPNTTTTTKITLQGTNVDTPELYSEDLDVLKTIMARISSLAKIDGVYEIEIRVRFDDVDSWAVIGYGDLGDPCVLRFEQK